MNHPKRLLLAALLTGVLSGIPCTASASGREITRRPNVLLIISDDLNTRIGPYMGINGHTPHLDQLAHRGMRFQRAYCQYPVCGPSRASFMSGLYCETNGELRNNDSPGSYRQHNPALAKHPSLAGFFREQGYFTARVSKIYHMGVPGGIERGAPGGDEPDSWDYSYNVMGPETMSPGHLELLSPANLHYGGNFSRMILPDERASTQTDYLAASQAIAILESRASALVPGATNKQKIKPKAPFFLGVGLVRPHVPLIAPASCHEPYPTAEVELPAVHLGPNVPEAALKRSNPQVWQMSLEQQRKAISSYMASVRFMDQQVGRILEALERLELEENTMVVFLSDHGYNLGEHDCWSKGALWEGMVRVPLIISHPAAPSQHGKEVEHITELVDLYPTLAALCGFDRDLPQILQGDNLAPLVLKGEAPPPHPDAWRDMAYTTCNGGKSSSLRSDTWRYTRWAEGEGFGFEELYNHQDDPEESRNLACDPDHQPILREMRAHFEQKRQQARSGLENQRALARDLP